MKKLISGFVALFALLLLANCSTQSKVPENIKRDWMLVEFKDFNRELMVNSKAHFSLIDENGNPGKFSANMGCNNMFGQATFNSIGIVKFSDFGSTMMYCDQSMDLETAFAKDLPKMTQYKVEGHYLTLTAPSGERMKFVASDWD